MHGQLLDRRLVFARSDLCFGKLDERVYTADWLCMWNVALQHTSVRHGHQRLRRDMVYGAAAGQTRRQRRVCQGRDSLAGYVQQRDDDNVDDDPGLIFGLTSVTFVYT